MNNYLQARQWLKSEISFEEFEQKLPSSLKECSMLSLLVGATMEQGLEPFQKYLELLVRQGADINYCQYQSKPVHNGVKMSLLMFACKKSKTHIVKDFLRYNHLQPYHRDQNGRNAVHYALENPDEQEASIIVKLLFEEYPLLKDMGNYSKGNYITISIKEGKASLLEVLIEEDIDPNYKSLEGLGPLHEAVRAHKSHKNKEKTLQILKVLLNAGCQEEEKNNDGQTYMNYARDKGYLHEQDIDQILEQMISSTTPKATIETSPEQKQNELFSIQSGDVNHDNYSSSESEDQSEDLDDGINHKELSQEMLVWGQEIEEERSRVWALVYPVFEDIQLIVGQYDGTIEVIGSFASRLWIPYSDLDFLITIPDGGYLDIFQDMFDAIFRKIATLGYHSSIRAIRSYKLPLIKLILTPEFQKLQLQLFFSSKKNISTRYVSYTNEILGYYPDISLIYYVLRRLLSVRGLHDHRSGGLKAYALFLLIYTMRVHYQYPYISQFVEHFCYYYAFVYEYQVEFNSEGEAQYHINIVDPLNSDNNMGGKRTNIALLQEVLKKIYFGLNTGSKGSKLSYIADILRYI